MLLHDKPKRNYHGIGMQPKKKLPLTTLLRHFGALPNLGVNDHKSIPAAEINPTMSSTSMPRWLLWTECVVLFLILPAILAHNGFHRPTLYTALWMTGLYCIGILHFSAGFSWRRMWQGDGWSRAQRHHAIRRFALATAGSLLLLALFAPERIFDFPRSNTGMWAMVMIFYPLISVVPQEFVFRSFFFTRYAPLLPQPWLLIGSNAFVFGLMHLVMQNWVAPVLSAIGGVIFAYGYTQHRSLKWASLEHAAYGCMIFTVGLGWFFFRGLS